MNVLFFTKHYLNKWGGIQENVYNIAHFLKVLHKVTISSPIIDGAHIKSELGIEYKLHATLIPSDYDVIFLENFDIFPHFLFCIKIIWSKVLLRKKTRLIFVPHGGFTLRWSLFSITKRVTKFLYNQIFGKTFINVFCESVVAVSEWEKEALTATGIKRPIVVIRNGFDMTLSRDISLVKKENYFVFLGRIDRIKNIEEIIDTVNYLRKTPYFAEFSLKIIGDYTLDKKYYTELKERVDNLCLSEVVEFIGPKNGFEKYKILSQASCLLCLSHMENDPVVIKEAFSVKTKVLINSNYGLADYKNEKNVFVKMDLDLDRSKFEKFLKLDFDNRLSIDLLDWGKISDKYEELI